MEYETQSFALVGRDNVKGQNSIQGVSRIQHDNINGVKNEMSHLDA